MNISLRFIETPLGKMLGCATPNGVCLLEFDNRKNIDVQIHSLKKCLNADIVENDNPHLIQLEQELSEYFSKTRKEFSVELDMIGTDFQKQVWNELLKIPYGKTISYIQEATSMGKPESVRAVANANGMNKIAIVVPCHRVIGSDGTLTGYAGGLDRKRWLLDLESPDKKLFD
ncbi:methylated-DNA--[protein]-cysteine S-methyltransferase [Dysgonomonas sp. OttesenSCG-928-M03]|nr:methylated-DNA--[protein]-cysteine S-methyltransferase [Dysgonomonas sp. OttesenSCG-928-M03]